jgi:hypothetical protein
MAPCRDKRQITPIAEVDHVLTGRTEDLRRLSGSKEFVTLGADH